MAENLPNTDKTLTTFMEQLSRLDDEIEGARDDRKDVILEAKAQGYDAKVLAAAYKRYRETKEQKAKREEQEMILDTYLGALGLL